MQNDTDLPGEFNKLVSEHFSDLTRSERRIADYIRQNQDEAAFMSAGEIALKLGLSEPTMTRFARALGFDNYPEMKEVLLAKFRERLDHSDRIRSRLNELMAGGDLYERLVTSEINFLTESIQTLNRDAFAQAVELLRTHQRIYVFGLGPAVSLVDLLEIRLTRSARHVIPLRSYGRELLDPLLLMDKDDLLIVIGLRSINPYLRLVLDQANQHCTPVILVTDTLGDLLVKNVTVVLAARRGPVSSFSSMTVPMTIINALLLALSSADQGKIMSNLDKLDELRESIQKMELEGLSNKKK